MAINTIRSGTGQHRGWLICLITAMLCLLAACGATSDPNAGKYGGNLNHMHDLLAPLGLPGVVLVASHFGLYRTADNGASWTLVAGGAGQPMDGLMIYRLAQDPANPHHLYVLAIPRTGTPQQQPSPSGLYGSTDDGVHWSLITNVLKLPDPAVYTLGIGPGHLFLVLINLAEKGTLTSTDDGQTWHALPATPDPHPTGIAGDPSTPNRLWLWSTASGLFRSDDGGQTWTAIQGMQNGVYSVAITGKVMTVSGADGIFRSTDDGNTFAAVTNGSTVYTSLAVAPSQAATIYALTGTSVNASTDGGQTFAATAPPHQHVGNITVDPANARLVYVASSYPIGIERSEDGGKSWTTVLQGT